MPAVTISPKYQIVIPREVREQLRLKPGQRVKLLVLDGVATLVPVVPIEELRGIGKGHTYEGYREEEDEQRWPS
ncbi:AbrB/MazE/SpoVT family DNA-binding domain-containing protein [bacterium]|nr:AbrB/MazE/SpoVT family DNA-binding domain-containing protein [bacterium]